MKVIPPNLTPNNKMFKVYAKYFKEQISRTMNVDANKGCRLLSELKETQPEIYKYITHTPLQIDKGLQEKLRGMLASTGYKQQ